LLANVACHFHFRFQPPRNYQRYQRIERIPNKLNSPCHVRYLALVFSYRISQYYAVWCM